MTDEMNPMERLLATFEQNPVDRIPVPGITQTGTLDLMEACGAYWPEAHKDPEKMAKLAWAAYEHAGLEGVRVPFIVYTEALSVGVELYKWEKDTQPMVKKFAFESVEELVEKMTIPDPKSAPAMSILMEAIEILKPKCEDAKIPITCHVASAFLSAFVGLVDMMKSMILFKNNPDVFQGAFAKTKELALTLAEAAIDAGSDVIFYNCAALGNFRPTDYEKYGFPVDEECIRKIKEMGANVVVHVCSDVRPLLDVVKKLNADAISIAEMVPMKEAREKIGDRVALMGNVNQLFTLIKKGPEDVMEEARKCIEEGSDILAPGCGFGPKTPLENMRALVEAAKKYGKNARLARR
ncbi:MAG: uroporphyrinogen decarboxylase family protein [Candidatus Syntropharchaeia archaeon]